MTAHTHAEYSHHNGQFRCLCGAVRLGAGTWADPEQSMRLTAESRIKAAKAADMRLTAESRINAGKAADRVLWSDDRTGDDALESDLTRLARDAGFALVEDDDGDLVLQSLPESA